MGVLGNHLLNCAGFHASDRGFGIATLNEDNYTWVLSRLAIELDEMPFQYEDFTIWTWVENVYRLFTDRNFALLDKDGKKIGYARSVWAMINLNTRKPADLLALHGGSIVDYVCDEPCPIEKPSRIKVTSTEPVATLKAKYSDIDINGHVNSIRYIVQIPPPPRLRHGPCLSICRFISTTLFSNPSLPPPVSSTFFGFGRRL